MKCACAYSSRSHLPACDAARRNWDNRFMDQARLIASWSKDPSTKVGAVIVNGLRQVLGQGFNGFPRGVHDLDERYADRPTKYAMVVHSEANAILNARQDVSGCTLYTTMFPCSGCTKLIIQAGITSVVCPAAADPAAAARWAEDQAISRTMLAEAGVHARELASPPSAPAPPWAPVEYITVPVDPVIELRELAEEWKARRGNPEDESVADELAERVLLTLEVPS